MLLSPAHLKARRGAIVLDRQKPGWADLVDPDELSIASCRYCILGQVFGDYVEGLFILHRDGSRLSGWPHRHGFVPMFGGHSLEHHWKRQIAMRVKAKPAQVYAREEDLATAGD